MNRRQILAGSVSLIGLSLIGCDDSNTDLNNVQPPIGRLRAKYVVSGNRGTPGINVYTVNEANGALTQVAGSPFSTGGGTVFTTDVHPSGLFVYAGGHDNDQIIGYTLTPATGALTALAGFPIATVDEPHVLIERNGNFLYALGQTSIDAFRINTGNGALTRLAGFPLAVPGMLDAYQFTVDATNRFMYITDEGSNQVFGFSINQQTGALTALPTVAVPGTPQAIEIDPSNQFLYVASRDGNIRGFSINANTGALTGLAGFPVVYAPAGAITGHFDFRNGILYLPDAQNDTLSAFTVNNTSGALTQLAGFPIFNAGGSSALAYPNLPFLYVSEFTRNRVVGYQIGANGQLTVLPNSPFPAGTQPTELNAVFFG